MAEIFIFILEKPVKWSQYGDNLPVHDDLLIMIFYGAGTKDMDIFSVILNMGSWKGKLIQIYILKQNNEMHTTCFRGKRISLIEKT